MVSNSLNMKLQELLGAIEKMRKEQGRSAEYQKLRSALPKDWPL